METLNVTVADGQKTLIVRQGDAPVVREKNVISIKGDINTVKNYVAKRYNKNVFISDENSPVTGNYNALLVNTIDAENVQHFTKDTAIVTFDAAKLSISLETNPQDYFGVKVLGTLELADELVPFGINSNKTFSREELVKLIRFNKRFFADPGKQDDMLRAFQTLNLSGTTNLKAESDNRGNKDAAFKKVLDSSNLPTVFFLEVPVYKGLPKVKFSVELCLDSSESAVIFWFESVELKELMDSIRDKIFDEQKELFSDFVIVNK